MSRKALLNGGPKKTNKTKTQNRRTSLKLTRMEKFYKTRST